MNTATSPATATVIHIGYRSSFGPQTFCGFDVEELPPEDTWTLDRHAANCERCAYERARDPEAA